MAGEPGPAAVDASPSLRRVGLPSEHGGWSLTAEPIVLGLVVAWSWPGMALGAAALLAFVARTPLKVVLVDRWRDRWLDRTSVAARLVVLELTLIGVLGALAVAGAEHHFWVPLAVAAPLVALELWYDMRSRSRRLVPELAGTVGIGSVAAAIALADGEGWRLSVGLWCVVAARSIAAIPHVRTQLDRVHHRPARQWESDVAQVAAVAVVLLAWLLDAIPLAPVLAMAAVAAVGVVAVRAPPRPAVVIGVQQMVLGAAVVAITAAAVLAT